MSIQISQSAWLVISGKKVEFTNTNIQLRMKKADLVEHVNGILGTTKAEAERVVNGIFDAVAGELAKGGQVDVAGFGTFEARARAARKARNPRTGESVDVPATTVPKFKASKTLKDTVAGK